MEIKDIRVGNVVRVEAGVFDRDLDLIGTIKGIYPYHVVITDYLGIMHSIKPVDFPRVHLVEEAGFNEYGEEDFYSDVESALKKG